LQGVVVSTNNDGGMNVVSKERFSQNEHFTSWRSKFSRKQKNTVSQLAV